VQSRNRRSKGRPSGRQNGKNQITEATVIVTALGRHGHGIAETEKGRIFIPYSLPAETVRVEITGDSGKIVEIIKASENRIEPVCQHFGECGGCAVQHMRDDDYREWKKNIVTVALHNQELDADVGPLVDAHGAGRRRVTFHVRRDGDHVQVGFMQARSHQINDIRVCPVLSPVFSDAIAIARDLAQALSVSSRGLDIQLTECKTGLDCNVVGTKTADYDQHMSVAAIADHYDLARLTLDGEMVAERRKPHLTMDAAQVTLPVGGFLQATLEGETTLAGLVNDYAVAVDAHHAADLFCGIGSYALRLAKCARVFAVDNNAASIGALSTALRHTPGLKPVTPVVRDLFDNPVSAEELNTLDFVVFNPPRAGAQEQAIEIAASNIPTVVAVSCDPSTFARDARILVDGGYRLERVVPVDQFKWAAHVEIVGLFTRT